jgi:peptide-methionine (R)-S-oxide reductase
MAALVAILSIVIGCADTSSEQTATPAPDEAEPAAAAPIVADAEPAEAAAPAKTKEASEMSEADWKEILTPEQYRITRQCGTEPPWSGKYVNHKRDGVYTCVCCGKPLFDSATKFDSGSGWPAFFKPVDGESISEKVDHSHGMTRTEVVCGHCDAHLGHVFNDAPGQPTGMRYCINSGALQFRERDAVDDTDDESAPSQ